MDDFTKRTAAECVGSEGLPIGIFVQLFIYFFLKKTKKQTYQKYRSADRGAAVSRWAGDARNEGARNRSWRTISYRAIAELKMKLKIERENL